MFVEACFYAHFVVLVAKKAVKMQGKRFISTVR